MSILIHSEFENFLFSSSFHQESLVFFLLSSSIAKHAEKRNNSSRTLHELFTNSEEKRGRSEKRETRTDEKDDLSEPSWSSIKLGGADPNFETINSGTDKPFVCDTGVVIDCETEDLGELKCLNSQQTN